MANRCRFKETAEPRGCILRPADPAFRFALEPRSSNTAQCRRVTSRVSKVLGAIGLSCGCATTYGPAFSKASPPKQDVYLYGVHSTVVSEAAEPDGAEREDEADAVDVAVVSKPPAKDSSPKSSKRVAETEQDAGTPSTVFALGTYKGTDWVTIDLPGFPANEQVDEKARVVLAKGSNEARITFTVLDTNSGKELCAVVGTVENELIAFDTEQACFAGILGVPMQTSVYEGEGRVGEEGLEVTLGVELTLTTPDGDEIVGDLSYRFAGKLTEPASGR